MTSNKLHYGRNNINTGRLKEWPEFCIDHFIGEDLQATFFFLTHAHTDHMVGLETREFLTRLGEPEVRLFCSAITPILVTNFDDYFGGEHGIQTLIREEKIVPLDVGVTYPFQISGAAVFITMLPAGHCPGSVMFYIEDCNYRVLHTGDCRVTVDSLKEHQCFFDTNGRLKSLHHLYVDTTFCSLRAKSFPCRKEAFTQAVEKIREWINADNNNYIHISFSAKFAHEFVLYEIHRRFRMKIHVSARRMSIYENIEILRDCVSTDPNTRFHMCDQNDCMEGGKSLHLRLSSMWYTLVKEDNGRRRDILRVDGRGITLCYSMHPSLSEIGQLINYFKPGIVTPLVKPRGVELNEIETAIKSVTNWKFTFEDYYAARNGNKVKLYADWMRERKLLKQATPTTSNNESLDQQASTAESMEEDVSLSSEEDEDDNESKFTECEEPRKKPKLDPGLEHQLNLPGDIDGWVWQSSPSPARAGRYDSSSEGNSQ